MTRFLLPLLLLLFSPLLGSAASSSDAVRALAHIVTFGPTGDTLAHAEGFFIDAAGTLVAPYAPFRGATRALITDSRRRQGACCASPVPTKRSTSCAPPPISRGVPTNSSPSPPKAIPPASPSPS